jgi:ATP-dependent RNA helicase DeaD
MTGETMKKLESTRISGVLINLKPDSGGGRPASSHSGGKPPGKKPHKSGGKPYRKP